MPRVRSARLAPALPLAVAAVLLTAGPVTAQEGPATVTVMGSDEVEGYLATETGRALYLFTPDAAAMNGAPPMSACHGGCAEAWPPLLADGAPQAGPGVQADLLGTLTRGDGTTQVTYAGRPLYRYHRDDKDGAKARGQGLHTHEGFWYLLRPDGTAIIDGDADAALR